ncbi:MAG: DNA replication/repair protein RecF [Limnochordaceae bacterium]|nr:DNA replication/repair protein RecF [Limnochordaceae bacterium]
MRVDFLRLTHYRNFRDVLVEASPGLNFLVGLNGQGKTNLLEALWVLAGARSPRAREPGDLVTYGVEQGHVHARVSQDATGVTRDVEVTLARGTARSYRLNGKPLPRAADVLGTLAVLWFSPDEVDLIRGGPADRRRFLDVVLAQTDGTYRRLVLQYGRILLQRNRTLQQIREGQAAPSLLDAWDEQLVAAGSYLTVARHALVDAIAGTAAQTYQAIAGSASTLEMTYKASGPGAADRGAADPRSLQRAFAAHLERLRAAELARGVTLAGPHRDDLEIGLDGVEVRRFGSRGQQRTAAVALHLAAWEWMRERSGEGPVLLLDDVASELDAGRRARLIRALPETAQVWLSATALDPEWLSPQRQAVRPGRAWRVSGGTLEILAGA